MSAFRLVKSMTRSLTVKEQKAIIKYWSQNQDLTESQVIEHWEKKLKMPITRHALMKAMIEHAT